MSSFFVRAETACFTGHREIPGPSLSDVRIKTANAIRYAYSQGIRTFLCGGARGFDTLAAEEVIAFRNTNPDVRLVIAIPCLSQADKWPARDRTAYQAVLASADERIVLSDKYYNGCMQQRNRYMVDHSSLCLCYLTHFSGGTWSTVRYAMHEEIAIVNLAMRHDLTLLKELPCYYISTSLSVQKNVSIVHLSPFRHHVSKKKNTSKLFYRKQR